MGKSVEFKDCHGRPTYKSKSHTMQVVARHANLSHKAVRFLSAKLTFLVALAIGSLEYATTLDAKVIYVKALATGAGGDGTSWAQAMALSDALAAASGGDDLYLAGGTYGSTDNNTNAAASDEQASSIFTVSSAVNIYGGFNGSTHDSIDDRFSGQPNNIFAGHPSSTTTILGANGKRPLYLKANARLDGLTIQGGSNVAGEGGGVYVKSGATIWKCKIKSNSATSNGGGLYVKAGTVKFVWSYLQSNTSSGDGGGFYFETASSATMKAVNSYFTSNTAAGKGGAGSLRSSVAHTFEGCSFSGSSASSGRTMVIQQATFKYCTFSTGTSFDNMFFAISTPTFSGSRFPNATIATDAGGTDNSGAAGTSTANLPTDGQDVDGDGKTSESLPLDIRGYVRDQTYGATSTSSNQLVTYAINVTLQSEIANDPDFDAALFSVTGANPLEDGEVASLRAVPAPHWDFVGWSGGATSTSNPLSITGTNSEQNFVATFRKTVFTLTLNSSVTQVDLLGDWVDISSIKTGGGATINVGLGDESNSSTNGSYPNTAVITAFPAAGYYLRDWGITSDTGVDVNASTSADYNATSPLTLTYEANWTVTPYFAEALYTLNVETETLESSLNGGAAYANGREFRVGNEAIVYFTPATDFQLAYMTLTNNVGQEVNATTLTDGNGMAPVIDEVNGKMTFTLGGDLGIDMIAKAYFEPISHGISIAPSYEGIDPSLVTLAEPAILSTGGVPTGSLLGNGKYTAGTILQISAAVVGDPNRVEVEFQYGNSSFKPKADDTGTFSFNPTLTEPMDIKVIFRVKQYSLKQRIYFGDGNDTYVELVSKYFWGDEVNSTVSYDAAGFDFNGTTYTNGNAAPSTFTLTDDITINTRFQRKLHLITTAGMTADENGTLVAGGGTVAVKPSLLEFEHGQQVQFQAMPDDSYQFDHWEWSGLQSTDQVLSLTAENPLALVAVFAPRQYRFDFLSEPRTGASWFANNVSFADGTSAIFTHGDVIEIQAAPTAGYDINGTISMVDSSGAPVSYQSVAGSSKRITLTVDSNATVSGVFSRDYADFDGDGLDNYTESLYGSNPYLSDSDGDSMDDKWEVTYFLNPVDPLDAGNDDDYDGLTSLQEFQSGTFPRNPDSNGDGIVDVYNPKDTGTALLEGYSFVKVDVVPFGAGIVTGEGAYENNSSATITLYKANPGYVFVNWQGDLSGSDRNGTVFIDTNKTIIANFSFDNRDTDGDGIDNYNESLYGTDANSTDTDGDGIRDDVEIAATTQVADLNVTGVFNPTKSDAAFLAYLSSVNLSSGVTSGSSGSGSGSSLLYDFINGWFYTSAYGWSFATSSSDSVYNSRVSTWLSFQQDSSNALKLYKWDYPSKQWVDYGVAGISGQYNLTVTKNVDAGGEVSASSSYASGTEVTIKAIPNPGYHFIGWEGDVVSSNASASFVIDKNISVQAVFLTDAELSNLLGGTQGN